MKWLKLAVVPAVLASLVLLSPLAANAGRHNNNLGAGIIIGAAFGAIAGAAIANSNNNNYYNRGNYRYNRGYRQPYYNSCKRVVRVCRDRYGPYGRYQRCTQKVRWVC